MSDASPVRTHTVGSGDTLGAIATRYGIALEDLDLIIVGQKLTIPAQGLARGR